MREPVNVMCEPVNAMCEPVSAMREPDNVMCYDTGEQFYAPGSFARFIRSRKTGKLYWIGNISREPAKGGVPKFISIGQEKAQKSQK